MSARQGKTGFVKSLVTGIEGHHTRFEALSSEEEEEEDFPEISEVKLPPAPAAVGTRVRRNRFEKVPRSKWVKFGCGKECDCERDGTEGWEAIPETRRVRWLQPVESKPASEVRAGTKAATKVMSLNFQVADVQKPLIAVRRIAENGNHVAFGPGSEDNYILSKTTGEKLMLRPNGKGSYLMDVCFVGGGRAEITVDSGAEESVCPWDWGSGFAIKPASKWMTFKSASGDIINHYGTREVMVVSPF